MLVGLLPLVGWANAPLPDLELVSDYTTYKGDNIVVPTFKNNIGQVVKVVYNGPIDVEGNLIGDFEPVVTFENGEALLDFPIREAGEYTIFAVREVREVENPQARANDPALNDPTNGDPEGEGDGEEQPVEFTYKVYPREFQANPKNINRVYGDEETELDVEYSLVTTQFMDGDEPVDYKVVGGYVAFSNITTNVGSIPYWGADVEGNPVMWNKVSEEICYNYWISVTGTASVNTVKAPLYAKVGDMEKVYGQCDEDVFTDENIEITYTGFVNNDKQEDVLQIVDGYPVVIRNDMSENVGTYQLGLETETKGSKIVVKGVTATNYDILPAPAEEQGKLTITQKSITEEMVSSIKYFVDGFEAAYNEETGEVEGFTYGKVLTWEITMIDNDVCISETGKRELTDGDVDKPVCVDGDCGDDLEICGKGNYKDCIPFRVPDPQPTCLNITAGAEPGEFTLGEQFEIIYEITGWQKDEDFSEAVEDVISYEIFDADGEKVEQPIENAGEYTVKFTVGDLPAEPAGLANYKVCDEPEDITVTVDPICIEDATITIERTEGADNCFPFTGSKIEPAVTVTLGDKELVKGTDYTVTYGNEEKDNIHPTQGGIITVTGINNYECDVTTEFCIAPGEATVKVAPVSFDDWTIIEGVKYYQNGKFYGQAEPEIILEYEGITAEELKALGLDIKGQRYNGENVGFYSVAIFNGEEQLTTGVLKFNGEDPVETNTLTTVTRDFGDITITFEPGTFEIRKNQTQLEFHAEIEEVYGEIGVDIQKLRTDKDGYLAELIEKYFDDFEATGFQGNDNQSKLRNSDNSINLNIVDPWGITFDDIAINGVSITKDGVPNMELFKDVICNPTGYIHAGTYHVDIVGATSPNYNIGTIDMDVTITQRPIKITIEDVELAPREEIDLTAVNWTAEDNKPAPAKRGYAVLDAPLDIDNSILNVVIIVGKTTGKLAVDKTVFNPDYKPEYNYGEITNAPGHFIIHRVAADLQDNPWNDAVAKITAFDGQTVDRVYFRTFNLAGTDNLFDDLFNDGELEPVTAEVDGELDPENGFPMYAKKWYAMVLPFDVTVYELGREFFEYGVINVLDVDNEDENVIAFKLQTTGIIPANTPFCVQLGDMGRVTEELPFVVKNLDQMYFENKTIVKPENFDEIEVHDKSGVKFYASYTGKLGFAENERYYTTSANPKYDDGFLRGGVNPNTGNENTTWMRPTGAFLSLPADQARTIIMQEEDGTYTQIKAIENINSVKSTEGWFTTNGMKLNAQPTEKGIYIHNGKKVVVK